MHTEDLQHVDQNKRIALYKRTDTKSMVWHARFRIEARRNTNGSARREQILTRPDDGR